VRFGNSEDRLISRQAIATFPGFISPSNYRVSGMNRLKNGLDFVRLIVAHSPGAWKTVEEKKLLNECIISHLREVDFDQLDSYSAKDISTLEKVALNQNYGSHLDKDVINAFLSALYYKHSDTATAIAYRRKTNLSKLLSREKINEVKDASLIYNLGTAMMYQQLDLQATDFSDSTLYNAAFKTLSYFPEQYAQRNALLQNINGFQLGKKEIIAVGMLDTLLNRFVARSSKFGVKLFEILGRSSTVAANKIAVNLIKDVSDAKKLVSFEKFILGKADAGDYFDATTYIPDYFSSTSQLRLFNAILKGELKRRAGSSNGWSGANAAQTAFYEADYEDSEEGMIYVTSE
jgi:hypothetical protein